MLLMRDYRSFLTRDSIVWCLYQGEPECHQEAVCMPNEQVFMQAALQKLTCDKIPRERFSIMSTTFLLNDVTCSRMLFLIGSTKLPERG